MCEELALAACDIAFWKRRAELAAALALTIQAQRDRAEAEAAAWIAFVGEAAWQLEHGAKCEEIQSDLVEAYQRAVGGNAPGVALLAELEAARALRAAVRPLGSMAQLNEACAVYDEAVQARAT